MRIILALLILVAPLLAKKNILFIAGKPSHSNGEHEHRAGCMLLAKALNQSGLDVEATVHFYGWPKDESILEGVDALIIYADAGGRLGKKVELLDAKIKAGMGIGFIHYGVHPSKQVGDKYFKNWIGGFFETGWSVNPHWIASLKPRKNHPVSRGLPETFPAYDEFYYNMRFPTAAECDCCHPLATAVPSADKMIRYINLWNEHGEACFGSEQALMWCRDPSISKDKSIQNQGRGFGFTGGHYHCNWAIDEFRTLVLNTIVWAARGEVPAKGVPSKTITQEQLNENLDRPKANKPILLPTAALLKQKAMKQPRLKAKKKGWKKPKKNKKDAPVSKNSKVLYKSPDIKAADKNRIHNVTADIKGLTQIELHVDNLGEESYDWANWLIPTFQNDAGKSIPLDKNHIASSTQGRGNLHHNKNVEGKSLTVAGKAYKTGLGTHATSSIIVNVPKGAVKFTAQVALDDGGAIRGGKPTPASVHFIVRTTAPPTAPPNPPWESERDPEFVNLDFFKLPADLEVSLWATSPLLYNPTNIDIDHKGRIWVAEGVNYRRHKGRRPKGDRIAVLTDTDGDGKADKSHTFVQETALVAPLGVAVFDNIIYVSQPPELLVYTDINRDLKFDPAVDKREVLLTGFNARNHDHSLHSVTAGPDGKFYFNNGNCGAVFKDRSGKNFYMGGPYKGGGGDFLVDHLAVSGKRSDDGHIWTSGFTVRMNPDGTNCEIIGHGYRNSYEQSLDSFGNAFQNDNDDPPACRVSYILEYGCAGYFTRDAKQNYRAVKRPGQDHGRGHWRQDDPGTMDAGHIYGGGSPTGVTVYETGALPEKYNGSFFSCEPGKNTVFHYRPEPKGATFKLEQDNLVTTNPNKKYAGSDFVGGGADLGDTKILFRPSDICVGPDGALYISDWYDARVGGHADRDDSCSGTIYRIAPKGFKPSVPTFDLNTIEGAITALKSPAINTRFLGFSALKKHRVKAIPAVEKLIAHPNKRIAARGIWVLPHLGGDGISKCSMLLNASDSNVQLTAYRALRRTKVDMIPVAEAMANHTNPAILRDVALSLRDLPASKTKHIFAKLAAQVDHTDKNAIEAIGLGAANQESEIWLAIKETMKPGAPHEWSEQFAKLTWRLWPTAAVADLKARAIHPSLPPGARKLAVESLAFINDKTAVNAMLALADHKLTKSDATYWLLRNGTGEWKAHNIAGELKTRGIYDPDKIEVTPITVPVADKPKFTVAQALALKGNAEKGKTTAMRCVMCHEFNGQGVNYGPNLKGWGAGQTKEVIARSIIEPSADLAHGYKGHLINLKDGGQIHGLLASQSDPLIMTSTGGLTQLVPKKKIKGKPTPYNHSLMLSADQLGLTRQDVADLVEFLKGY